MYLLVEEDLLVLGLSQQPASVCSTQDCVELGGEQG